MIGSIFPGMVVSLAADRGLGGFGSWQDEPIFTRYAFGFNRLATEAGYSPRSFRLGMLCFEPYLSCRWPSFPALARLFDYILARGRRESGCSGGRDGLSKSLKA